MLLLKLLVLCTKLVVTSSIAGSVCTIHVWEGLQNTLIGTYTDGAPCVIQKNTWVSYDLNNTLLATTTNTIKDGQRTEIKNIYDYKQRILYTIEGATCHKTLLDESFRNACVPQNFSYSWMKTYYGFEGPNLFWIWEYQGDWDGLHYNIQTTWDAMNGVIPVMEQTLGSEDGVPIFSNTAFLNVTAGIKDPGVFVPPSICKGVHYQVNQTIPRRLGFLAL